ncbi:MAG: prolyl oligopeptidase family serine peptidase [Bacteroidota bacterium]
MRYQHPSPAIADLVNLKPDPLMLFGPDRNLILMSDRPSYPSIADLREPKLKLAGRQINPQTFMPYGPRGYRNPRLRNLRKNTSEQLLGVPEDGRFRFFSWSPTGKRFGFCLITATGLQLWVGELATLACRPLGKPNINNSLGGIPFDFVGDDKLLVKRRIVGAERPREGASSSGPHVQVTSGVEGGDRTYANLLRNQADVDLFRYYANAQIHLVDLNQGTDEKWGAAGIISALAASPSKEYYLATYVTEPFSFNVPYDKFGDRVVLLDATGQELVELEQRPHQEQLPPAFGSVITERRRFTWRSDHPAQLYWTEAQDGGDPRNEAEVRDRLYYLDSPFTGPPQASVSLPLRFGAVRWCRGDLALVIDWSWKERQQVTRRWWPDDPARPPEILFDHNWEDNYGDPGNFVTVTLRNDHTVLLTREEGRKLVLVGEGHAPEGSRPFIDTFDVATREVERIWSSTPPYFERPLFFLDETPDWYVLAREQLTERPNYSLREINSGQEIQLTNFAHPYPQLRDAHYEKVHYQRVDGVQLSGDLHTPQGFRPGTDAPLPVLMWAYPQEFKDADKAGQVTSSPHQFTRISPLAPLPFLAVGMAIFDDFAMPIVGEGDQEPNETFIDQVRMNAHAAVEKLVAMGVADPDRIYVGGHSYGAFMTAHLLAHTDLFAGGIARSGAYNRTLTPFGFQAEERTFWEVPDTYIKLSPFVHADKINAPLLLIHGDEDANSGTYPVQSKRMFAALNALGKQARLCLLPYEDHSYAAEESILHMLWEMERWMGREGSF